MLEQSKWNRAYKQGISYSPVSEIVLGKILARKHKGDVLDVGCGTGDLARQLKIRGYNPTGVDLSEVAINKARSISPNIRYEHTDFMDFDDGKYDIIFINLVLAFAKDRQAFLDHAKSMLRADGFIVIITPVLLARFENKYSPHLRIISIPLKELRELCPGYEEITSQYFSDYGVCKTIIIK